MNSYFKQSNPFDNAFNSDSEPYFKPYFKSLTNNTEAKVNGLTKQLSANGVKVPNAYDRSMLDRIIDAISVTSYPIMGALNNATDSDPNTSVLQGIGDGFKAANPFGQGYEQGEKRFHNTLDNLGWKTDANPEGSFFKPWTWDASNTAKNVVGFAGDVLLDPLTYMTFGLGGLAKGTGTTLARNSARELGQAGFKQGIENLSKDGFKQIMDDVIAKGLPQSKNMGEDMISKITRDAGYAPRKGIGLQIPFTNIKSGELVSGETMMKLGDNTIAPYINSAMNKIGDSSVGKYFNNTFRKGAKIRQEEAMANPERYAKAITFNMWAKDTGKKFTDLQNAFKAHNDELFKNVDEETKKTMTKLMETEHMFDLVTKQSDQMTRQETKEFKSFKEDLVQASNDFARIIKQYEDVGKFDAQLDIYKTIKNNIDNISSSGKFEFDELLQHADNLDHLKSADYLPVLNAHLNDSVEDLTVKFRELGIENPEHAAFSFRSIVETMFKGKTTQERQALLEVWWEKEAVNIGTASPHTTDKTMQTYASMLRQETAMQSRGYGQKDIDEHIDGMLKRSGNSAEDYRAFKADPQGYKQVDDIINTGEYDPLIDATRSEQLITNDINDVMEKLRAKNPERYTIKEPGKALDQVKTNTQQWVDFNDSMVRKAYNTAKQIAKERYGHLSAKDIKNATNRLFREFSGKSTEELNILAGDFRSLKGNSAIEEAGGLRNFAEMDEADKYINSTKKDYAGNTKDEQMVSGTKSDLERTYNTGEYDPLIDKARNTETYINADTFKYGTKDNPSEALKYLDEAGTKYPAAFKYDDLEKKLLSENEYLDTLNVKNPEYADTLQRIDDIEQDMAKIKDVADKQKAEMQATNAKNNANVYSDKEVLSNIYEFDGVRIIEPRNTKNPLRVDDIINAIKPLTGFGDKKLANFMKQFTLRITDINSWTEAATRAKNVFFTTNANATKELKNGMLNHEVAHNFANTMYDKIFGKVVHAPMGDTGADVGESLWQSLMKQEGSIFPKMQPRTFTNKDTGEVVTYFNAKTQKEDFAESFRMYINDTQAFAQKYPTRFEQINQYMKDFIVPDAKIAPKHPNAIKPVPQSVDNVLADKVNLNITARDALFNRIKTHGVSEQDAIKEFDLINKQLENPVEAFQTTNPMKSTHAFMPSSSEMKDIVLNEALAKKMFPTLSESELQLATDIKKHFYEMGQTEHIKNIDDTIAMYVTHMQSAKLRDGEALTEAELASLKEKGYDFTGKAFNMENKFNMDRKMKGTIDEINKVVKNATGKEDYFETSLSRIYLNRGLKHNQFIFNERYYDQLVKDFGTIITKTDDIAVGKQLYASTEQIQRTLSALDADTANKIIEQLKLPSNFTTSFKPIVKLDREGFNTLKQLSNDFSGFHIPEGIANDVDKMGKMMYEEYQAPLLNLYDKLLSTWKVNATAVMPGFHARNAVSNMFQNYLNVGVETFNPRLNYYAARMLDSSEKNMKYLQDTFIKTNDGKRISLAEIQEQAKLLGVNDSGAFEDAFKGALTQNIDQEGNFTRRAMLDETGEATKRFDVNSVANPLSTLFDINKPLKSLLDAPSDMVNKQWLPYQVGRKVGTSVEGQSRMLNFIANIKQGKGYMESADNTNKFLFDYFDLTETEQKVFKRIIPFYTWMRKNIPLQFNQLFENPSVAKQFGAAKANIESNVAPEDKVDPAYKNQFAQDWIQVPFKSQPDTKGKSTPQFLNPSMPIQDLGKFGTDPIQAIKSLISSSSPLIKAPVELMANKNMYFDSPISQGITDKANAPGYMQALGGGTKDDPVTISPELRYILQNLSGALENVGKAVDTTKSEETRGLSKIKSLTGLSLNNYNAEDYKKRALQERLRVLQDLKKQLKDSKK